MSFLVTYLVTRCLLFRNVMLLLEVDTFQSDLFALQFVLSGHSHP